MREGAIDLGAFLLPFSILAIAIGRLPWSRRWLTFLFAQLVAMAAVFAAIGAYQWVTRDVFWNPKLIVGNAYAPFYRVNSIFWDPSIYGRFLVVAIIACLVVVLARPALNVAAAASAGVAVLWVGLVLSFSQSSFAALVVAVLGGAAWAWGRRALVPLAGVAVLLVLVGFSAPSVRDEFRDDLDLGDERPVEPRRQRRADRARQRSPAWASAASGASTPSGRDSAARSRGGRRPTRRPVTVAAEGGILGMLLYGWLLLTALVVPLRRASVASPAVSRLSSGSR